MGEPSAWAPQLDSSHEHNLLLKNQRAMDRPCLFFAWIYLVLAVPVLRAPGAEDLAWRARTVLGLISFLLMAAWGGWIDDSQYSRWRNVMFVISKLLSGSAVAVNPEFTPFRLRGAPSQGGMGVLQDVFRILVGTRILNILLFSLFAPLPLPIHIPVQAFIVAQLQRGRQCRFELVRGYIPAILRMHHFTGLIFSPMRILLPFSPYGSLDPAASTDEEMCNQFFTFVMLVVGLLLSTTLLATLKPPSVRLAMLKPGRWRRLNDACMAWFDFRREGPAKDLVIFPLLCFAYQISLFTR